MIKETFECDCCGKDLPEKDGFALYTIQNEGVMVFRLGKWHKEHYKKKVSIGIDPESALLYCPNCVCACIADALANLKVN